MRSHPPALTTTVRRTLSVECPELQGARLLVALSGGGDSMALLHVLSRLRESFGFSLLAHGVDHGLRPEASQELDLAERFAASLGVEFSRTALGVAPGTNLQARARDARYAALSAVAVDAGASWLATAHHADDRAETVLMRLLSGAGPRGLAVLPPHAEGRLRPMIRARKSAVLGHLERHGIEHAADPSNQDRRFLRVRVRHELLPLLEQLSPQIVTHLTDLADQLGSVPSGPHAGQALGRAQIGALKEAILAGRSAEVRLSGGQALVVERSGEIRLVAGLGRKERVRKGGALSGKRH